MHTDCTVPHTMDKESFLVLNKGKQGQLNNGPEQR